MKSYVQLTSSGNSPLFLTWKQPKFSEDYYELVNHPTNDSLYADIGWPIWLSDRAIARSADGFWSFDRLGWTRRTISAARLVRSVENSGRPNHSELVPCASFEVGWFWEGDLVLNSGKVFHWYRTKTLRNAWAMTEVISNGSVDNTTKKDDQGKPISVVNRRKGFSLRRQPKLVRRERLVYEIEFGIHWFKPEAWIPLTSSQLPAHPELIFLLCAGMYLGYCYNQDNAAVAAVSVTAAVS